ncbi:tetraspanin-13b isoform X2 [Electrophorus electricus]|uniref:tetraspanin-13b isoform X2 n=1 Tax=Electrophorus electricus TaxID=8005 RepID=UPI000F0A76D6|nr:tetraspanin-13b isoform X2 [Electrophorus electricus]
MMGCAGFTCSKNSLCALNILYVMVSMLMIGIAAWGKWFGLVSSFQVVWGIIGVGVFLFLVALAGLVGAVKHHQGQGGVYCSGQRWTFSHMYTSELLEVGWNNSKFTQMDVEKNLNCCGFYHMAINETCTAACFPHATCNTCAVKLQEHVGEVLRFVGETGLFFSFTEILAVWLTYRYRNQKDPRANPSAFL